MPGLRLTCIQALANGWITACDLCPRCTRRFMAALEAAAGEGEPLTWHQAYRDRAGQADQTGTPEVDSGVPTRARRPTK